MNRIFHLTGPCTIEEIGDVMSRLRKAVGSSSNLEIDLSEVTAMDVAGLQLLISAKKECELAKKVFRVTGRERIAGLVARAGVDL